MKYLNMAKYRLFDMKDSLIIYYVIILMIQLGKIIIIKDKTTSIILPEMFVATAIFLFVAGLNSFKPQFKFLCQNGFTRQNIHWGFAAFLPVTIIISVIDYAIYSIQNVVYCMVTPDTVHNISYNPFNFKGAFNNVQSVLVTMLSCALAYAAAMAFGYMVSALFYRLNKMGKILIAVAVPATIAFTMAMESIAGFEGLIYSFAKSLLFGSPHETHYAGHFIVVLIFSIILSLSASHLLIRKATIKT